MRKEMLKRIYTTVVAYYETNKDVLSDSKIEDLVEQKTMLEKEMRKFWK